jgi:hypothetical protein
MNATKPALGVSLANVRRQELRLADIRLLFWSGFP